MYTLIDSLVNVLTAFSRVLRPLADFNLALLNLTTILTGWLRPLANLLENILWFLR